MKAFIIDHTNEESTMPHPYEKITDNPEEGFTFLKTHKAKLINENISDTEKRATYEIPDENDSVFVLIESESRLESPYYYYRLYKYVGEE